MILAPVFSFSLEIGVVASCESSEPLLATSDAFGVAVRIRDDLLVAMDSSTI